MNAFATYGDSVVRAPKPRAPRRLVEVQKEDAQLRRQAHAAERAELDAILTGPYGAVFAELRRRCRAITLADGARFLVWIEANQALRTAPDDVRALALRMIDKAIVRVRVKSNLPPFDDGIAFGEPSDPPKAMHVVKQMLGVR